MVHGDCSSRGCYAMTDEQIQDIYALARESFFGGQKSFQLQAFPFRMTALNMAKHRNNPNFAFWKMIKEGYDHFEATRLEPKVAVCEKRYVFDATALDDSTKPLSFNAKGACPAYQLDKNIAQAVLDYSRQEQYSMAKYMAEGVQTVAFRTGIDGGMNPVFADRISTQVAYDNKGNAVHIATAPGSLPRTDGGVVPATTITVPKAPDESAAVQVADTTTSPAPAQKSASAGGLFGNLFGGSQRTATAEDAAPVLRGTNTELAAKPKRAAPATRTASVPQPKPQPAAAPKTVANAEPVATKSATKDDAPSASAQAYSSAPASKSTLAGSQPVVPTGTFASRWSASGFR
jgi:hypothetical protein